MSKRVRVNVSTRVLANSIRREERNGRPVIVVPSTTMPDDIVMNGVMYPAEEIKTSFMTLNRTMAPFGHPEDAKGQFLSASDPEAINQFHVGAWNENVRQKKGEDGRYRVHVDKVIDETTASQTEQGRELLDAIEKGEPIHTSTGLWANISEVDGEEYNWTAADIEFDHDAILLHETGAATPDQGVGMMVNKNGVTVINSMLEDAAEQDIEWGLETTLRGLERKQRLPMIELMKTALWEIFSGSPRETTATNSKETSKMENEQFETLSATVDALAEDLATMKDSMVSADSVAEAVANAVKPLTDQLAATTAANEAKEKAELDGYVEKIVKANVLTEDAAKELTLNVAREMAEAIEPGTADVIAAAKIANKDAASQYKLPGGDS